MAATITILCKHCNKKHPCRPRGLCWRCYYTPGVRDMYPVNNSVYNRRGVEDFNNQAPLPEPTDKLPITEDKVKEITRRAELRQSLWHPNDAKRDCS